jgi:hypothetical protein
LLNTGLTIMIVLAVRVLEKDADISAEALRAETLLSRTGRPANEVLCPAYAR